MGLIASYCTDQRNLLYIVHDIYRIHVKGESAGPSELTEKFVHEICLEVDRVLDLSILLKFSAYLWFRISWNDVFGLIQNNWNRSKIFYEPNLEHYPFLEIRYNKHLFMITCSSIWKNFSKFYARNLDFSILHCFHLISTEINWVFFSFSPIDSFRVLWTMDSGWNFQTNFGKIANILPKTGFLSFQQISWDFSAWGFQWIFNTTHC